MRDIVGYLIYLHNECPEKSVAEAPCDVSAWLDSDQGRRSAWARGIRNTGRRPASRCSEHAKSPGDDRLEIEGSRQVGDYESIISLFGYHHCSKVRAGMMIMPV